MKIEIDYNKLNKNYSEFIIDSSSLIYLNKARVLDKFLSKFKIYIIEEVKKEIEKKENFLIHYKKNQNLLFLTKIKFNNYDNNKSNIIIKDNQINNYNEIKRNNKDNKNNEINKSSKITKGNESNDNKIFKDNENNNDDKIIKDNKYNKNYELNKDSKKIKIINNNKYIDNNNYKKIKNSNNNEYIDLTRYEKIDKISKISSTDLLIIKTALKKNLPLITEDKKIMEVCKNLDITFFNSLIVIYFLVKNKIYSKKEGINKLFALSNIGWYSDKVFKLVFDLIDNL